MDSPRVPNAVFKIIQYAEKNVFNKSVISIMKTQAATYFRLFLFGKLRRALNLESAFSLFSA